MPGSRSWKTSFNRWQGPTWRVCPTRWRPWMPLCETPDTSWRRIPAKEAQFARLERSVKGLEEIVLQLRSRLKETEVAQVSNDETVRLIDVASSPRAPLRSRRPLILAFACCVRVGPRPEWCLHARVLWTHSVHSQIDVHVATGLPIIGWIPRIRGARAPSGSLPSGVQPCQCRKMGVNRSRRPVPTKSAPSSSHAHRRTDEPGDRTDAAVGRLRTAAHQLALLATRKAKSARSRSPVASGRG